MTVLCHQRSTVHSIFQISISRNTICAEMVDFRKPGHNYWYANLTGLYLLNRTPHRHKLYTKRFISGALFHIPNYTRILFSDMRRERVEVQMSSFQLSDRVLYYRIPITCYPSIIQIGSFKYNCSSSFHSVTEKSKQKFPKTHTY